MLNWVVASRKRILIVGVALWIGVAIIAVLNPLKPGVIDTMAATWPLWLGIPVALVAVVLQFGSWATLVIIPITMFALIVYGEPWRERTANRSVVAAPPRAGNYIGRKDSIADTAIPARGAVADRSTGVNLALEATLEKTRVNSRRTTKKGTTA
ncbi:hypothetical protein [Leifsonia sp. TF02-11]|uniref:hypothetical protein n=1 Tax=Leifsonia sp. TF02-11 TaxID=2815212 RepID=UPI001AA0BE05|nr:hypothetical protein [Leifsonia sp. TF02-11]MBO1741033.1 hypothetical protein [Leifsonia sp. TF02-11]